MFAQEEKNESRQHSEEGAVLATMRDLEHQQLKKLLDGKYTDTNLIQKLSDTAYKGVYSQCTFEIEDKQITCVPPPPSGGIGPGPTGWTGSVYSTNSFTRDKGKLLPKIVLPKFNLEQNRRSQYPSAVKTDSAKFIEFKESRKFSPRAQAILNRTNFKGHKYMEHFKDDDHFWRSKISYRARGMAAQLLHKAMREKNYTVAWDLYCAMMRSPTADLRKLQRIGTELMAEMNNPGQSRFIELMATIYAPVPSVKERHGGFVLTATINKNRMLVADAVLYMWSKEGPRSALERLEQVIDSQPYILDPMYWALSALLAIDLGNWALASRSIVEVRKLDGSFPQPLVELVESESGTEIGVEFPMPEYEVEPFSEDVDKDESESESESSSDEERPKFEPAEQEDEPPEPAYVAAVENLYKRRIKGCPPESVPPAKLRKLGQSDFDFRPVLSESSSPEPEPEPEQGPEPEPELEPRPAKFQRKTPLNRLYYYHD